jgi:hypothetical protein
VGSTYDKFCIKFPLFYHYVLFIEAAAMIDGWCDHPIQFWKYIYPKDDYLGQVWFLLAQSYQEQKLEAQMKVA